VQRVYRARAYAGGERFGQKDVKNKPMVENETKLIAPRPRRKRGIRRSAADKAFDAMNAAVMVALLLLIVLPLLNMFSLAFSDGRYTVTFYPRHITVAAFKYVAQTSAFWQSALNSAIIVVVVTVGSNILMPLAAYPLSKRDCPLRKFFLVFFVITMLFSPGIIPSYLLMKALKLINTIWSIIILSILNVFNLLLYKTFFEGIPDEIEDAAKIDGAGGISLFVKIVMPMSLPVLASCCFFTLVGTWNSYAGALIFVPLNSKAWPLALYIYNLTETMAGLSRQGNVFVSNNEGNIRAAAIVLSIIPVMAVYPYVIRYIKSGLSVGSVKG
jgi:putative aldouronate transport system permease protein